MNTGDWFSLIKVILKHGSPTIPSYNYEQFQQDELEKINHLIKPVKKVNPKKAKLARSLLPIPFIGPLIALVSYYRAQKRWPTYIYHWPEKKLAYVRISKSGCTSLQGAILQKQYPNLDIARLSWDQIHNLGKQYIRPSLFADYTCFTVVRNPVNRLISCYHDKCLPVQKDFYYYQDYLFRIINPNLSIAQFVKRIKEIPDFVKDMHFRPQSGFVEGLEGIKIFKLEEDYAALEAFLRSYDLSLPHLHKNPMKKLQVKDLDPDTKNMIKVIYKKDFQNFNYSTDF